MNRLSIFGILKRPIDYTSHEHRELRILAFELVERICLIEYHVNERHQLWLYDKNDDQIGRIKLTDLDEFWFRLRARRLDRAEYREIDFGCQLDEFIEKREAMNVVLFQSQSYVFVLLKVPVLQSISDELKISKRKVATILCGLLGMSQTCITACPETLDKFKCMY